MNNKIFKYLIRIKWMKFFYLIINKLYKYKVMIFGEKISNSSHSTYLKNHLNRKTFKLLQQALDSEMTMITRSPKDKNNPIVVKNLDCDIGQKILSLIDNTNELKSFCRHNLGRRYIFTRAALMYSPNLDIINNSSQEFHFDYQATNTIKVFINLHDIDYENGPLEFLLPDVSAAFRKIGRNMFNNISKIRLDEDIDIDHSNVISNCGVAGTMLALNTEKCLHRGSRMSSKSRHLLFLEFYPFFNYEPRHVLDNCSL